MKIKTTGATALAALLAAFVTFVPVAGAKDADNETPPPVDEPDGSDVYEKFEGIYGKFAEDLKDARINVSFQDNRDANLDADVLGNKTNLDADPSGFNRGTIGDYVDLEIVNTEHVAAGTLNAATNAIVLGEGVVFEDNTAVLGAGNGPVAQLNKQYNHDSSVEVEVDENEVFLSAEAAKTFLRFPEKGSKPVLGVSLTIDQTDLIGTAIGNQAANAIVGDLGAENGKPKVVVNASIQVNDDVDVEAFVTENEINLDADGKFHDFDFEINNTTASSLAIGNDVANTIAVEAPVGAGVAIVQLNVQANRFTNVAAETSDNKVNLDLNEAFLRRGTASIANTSFTATAIGNRAVNRIGGPDLGGIRR